jgi:predicted outer membrane repeat protein
MRKLQTAIAAADAYLDVPAQAGHRVLIRVRGATGAGITYYPDQTSNPGDEGNRSLSFTMRDHVDILGGYVGTVEDPESRDPCIYFSILSGDLADPPNDGPNFQNYNDNSRTIVKAENLSSIDEIIETVDGFIIRGASNEVSDGGGVYVNNSGFTIRNCEIRENRVSNVVPTDARGGGVSVSGGSTVTIDNCIIDGNESEKGSAIKVRENSAALISRCTVTNNHSSGDAGGLGLDDSPVTVVNCTFRGNTAEKNGGAIQCYDAAAPIQVVTLTNCLFHVNSAEETGGAIQVLNADVEMNCCTVVNNVAGESYMGGGWVSTTAETVQLSILNSIFWGNEAGLAGEQIFHTSGTLRVAHSDIQGDEEAADEGGGDLDWASSNLDVDPEFRSSTNFRLRPTSACIDHSGAEPLPTTDPADLDQDMELNEPLPRDLDVDLRVVGSAVDMGAYEYQPGSCPADCGGVADCVINVTDLLELLCQWGEPPQGSGSCDIDEDDEVDVSDLLALLAEWGNCAACGGTGGGGVICRTVSECMAQHAKPEDQYACLCGGCLSGQITEGCPPECQPGSGP